MDICTVITGQRITVMQGTVIGNVRVAVLTVIIVNIRDEVDPVMTGRSTQRRDCDVVSMVDHIMFAAKIGAIGFIGPLMTCYTGWGADTVEAVVDRVDYLGLCSFMTGCTGIAVGACDNGVPGRGMTCRGTVSRGVDRGRVVLGRMVH